eukprot:7237790-Pyramimonas_sp.AAC.2
MNEKAPGWDRTPHNLDELGAHLCSNDPVLNSSSDGGARDHALAVGREEERISLAVVLSKLGHVRGAELALRQGEAGANLLDLLAELRIVPLHLVLPTFDLMYLIGLCSDALRERVDVVGHLLDESLLGVSHRVRAELLHVGNRRVHALLDQAHEMLLEVAGHVSATRVSSTTRGVRGSASRGGRPCNRGGRDRIGISSTGEGGHDLEGGNVLGGEAAWTSISPRVTSLECISG